MERAKHLFQFTAAAIAAAARVEAQYHAERRTEREHLVLRGTWTYGANGLLFQSRPRRTWADGR